MSYCESRKVETPIGNLVCTFIKASEKFVLDLYVWTQVGLDLHEFGIIFAPSFMGQCTFFGKFEQQSDSLKGQ